MAQDVRVDVRILREQLLGLSDQEHPVPASSILCCLTAVKCSIY